MSEVNPQSTRWSSLDMLIVAAARRLASAQVCFAGIGLPSAAAILASRTCAPGLFLIFESGVLGPRPSRVPLSVADETLAETADTIVSVPEIFAYWLQPGRIDVGVIGAAQIDRFGNINSTVIGDYRVPQVRLPGAGGAPEIAAACAEVVVVLQHTRRSFVESVDFVTTFGHRVGPTDRSSWGLLGKGPTTVITDLAILEPDVHTRELTLTGLHPGVTIEQILDNTGWSLRVADRLTVSPEPSSAELTALHSLRPLS